MVEDDGEAESIGKLVDTFCTRKEIVEEDVTKGHDEVNFKHENSAINAPSKRSKMGNRQRKVPKTQKTKVKGYVEYIGTFFIFFSDLASMVHVLFSWVGFNLQALYNNCCTITTIKGIHRSLNDEQVKVVKELGFGELVKIKPFEIPEDIVLTILTVNDDEEVESVLRIKSDTIDIIEALVKGNYDSELEREFDFEIEHGMIPKWNRENKASVVGCVYILYMECFYLFGERMLLETSRNLTRVLNWDKSRVLNRVIALRGIGLFRGEDISIIDIEELGVDVRLEGVHKRLDLLDQNIKELRGCSEGVRKEVTCIGKSVEAAIRSIMKVVMKIITMLKEGLEDKLRDDIREEERRRQKKFSYAFNKMAGWKIENEQEKETPIEEYVGSDNQYNDMKIDKDCFSDGNNKLSEGKTGGKDDDPLNSVYLKGLLYDIKTTFLLKSNPVSLVGV
ncbi:hypothetical protein M9H77_18582 [Catharanthus roseus]|uniref:Uncharacterized protein n=1 Tax=Catharanthus roseus TaxID=4058 RepID=A0ACC0B7U7_CATRO|nr:hypothetical protein M9H77_18582 [Catharanthus roseus]